VGVIVNPTTCAIGAYHY